jgi:hypothetical protein
LGGPARGITGGIDLQQRQPRMIQKDSARLCQLDSAGTAHEQFDANFQFQVADLAAQRRLRRVQPSFRGMGETAFFGNGNEIAQMAELHAGRSMPEKYGTIIQSLGQKANR